MEKAGILTFHRASNYGAVLQAYALQRTIEQIGFSSEIIDYRSPAIEAAHNPLLFSKKFGAKNILLVPVKIIKHKIFSDFRKRYLRLSEKADNKSIESIISNYTVLITGSDQVWNDKISGQDVNYFLPYNLPVRKYSYAASLGDSYNSAWIREMLAKFGSKFNTISLREKSVQDYVSEASSKKCRVDVDPTLLLCKGEWLEIAQKPKFQDPYILVYTLAPAPALIKAAKGMSDKTGMKIVFLNNSFTYDRNIKKTRFSTPEEFIGWFSEASFVFTNSFHGTVFSIIMNKPFLISKNAVVGLNKRSADLIQLLEIENRVLSEKADMEHISEIDWEKTNLLLSEQVRYSKAYLVSMFHEE
ncbi:MAG: polysaccharide pyruvyl transferase family protein [Anaerolineaceae bacterium]|nr:polysaccharide pyruvyl transferase family protein [Anaerolineaceae bacterium]